MDMVFEVTAKIVSKYFRFLARSANLTTGLYLLTSVICLFFYFLKGLSENNYLRNNWTNFHDFFTK